ncbi:glycogen debranching N-terminal domain-containing protein [Pseudomonas fluorescens]|uniref:D-inositol-3-phosphate glycosyltransferase n=1 Tax=Pseudomonas fluorescens TaxID=294 RepID=A0A5E7EIM5_PSEFL|nr:glycogen debranching N-terminal domain-containing protein [Pseudomonas fluorescens]VVO25703.1 D-inositol-3-phosphate glycosyltransferase [Pseudomonas fluorescens]
MKIAQIAPLTERCPPSLYGGTERIVSYLTEELVRQGHDVTLFASGDSQTQARLVSGSPKALRLDPTIKDSSPYHILMLDEVIRQADQFDVMHFHSDIYHFPLVRHLAKHTITTLHGRLDVPDYQAFYSHFPHVPLVSVSHAQRAPLPDNVNWVANIYHGLPNDLLAFNAEPQGDYLAFLGRISPEKRPDRAIEIALRANLALKIAAKIDKADQTYWDEVIAPLIASHRTIEFLGEIDEQQKADLLGNARALIFPIDWPEPFGLVMIEAMACGTPVIAFCQGSVPEVIDEGVSGYIVDNVADAVTAIKRLGELDRAKVRATFEKRFTVEQMAGNYLDLYRQLAVSHGNGQKTTAFEIPASASLQELRPRTLKHNDTFGVFDPSGDVLATGNSPQGIFHRDTRHLSGLYLTLNGVRPLLLSSTLRDDNTILTCDLTNPDLFDPQGQRVLHHDLIHLRRSRFLWDGSCCERLTLRNFADSIQHLQLRIQFAADFKDLFEVRGARRERRGEMHLAEIASQHIELSYTGLDHKRRSTRLRFDPAPASLRCDQALFDIELAPGESQSLFMEVNCGVQAPPFSVRHAFFSLLREARRELRTFSSRAVSIVTSHEVFNEAMRRSISDLYMLMTKTPQGLYPYAGIPWYSTVFGRDALITAWEMLWFDPGIARGVLGHLAANQATMLEPSADAEPGKILHEVRLGEMAELGEIPFRRYYGSIDSTPLFVMLAGAYLERTDDLATIVQLWPNLDAALAWIDEYGDRDGDGFIEYGRQSSEGLINQGWKDSYDSIFHADGRLAVGPIAVAEVQAYVYGAWNGAAYIAQRLGDYGRAQILKEKAVRLREQFDRQFFDEELGTYVLALDGNKVPCRIRTSNAGHALFSGIAYPERAPSVVAALMDRSSFSGWGVRTVASSQARFNPMSYHNGSVWPHDNALIAAGFARYGFRREAGQILEGMFAASTYIDLRRLPELFCGFSRQRSQGPTFYPVACAPQAWAAAAPLSMIQSCLGLTFNPAELQVMFDEPVLPAFLDTIILQRLEVGGSCVELALRRSGANVMIDVLDRRGPVRVISTN